MHLKRLEISGFKSFAEKTRIELSPGINIVVGPNGCGKSNIIDAVRWVLGEQKYTVLRSKSMDEVIFVGTDKCKAAGMASVGLTFDNGDNALPVDQPEVCLTRRIYKEGSGQYLLNGKNVRLKDFQELIADTGMGTGALFVLSNQEIDRVLSNAMERRSILEETAGINKYQLRKKETLRKLEATRENLARLADILQEVGRQVELSEKQMKKLERYKKVKDKLSKLEAALVKTDLEEIASKFETLSSFMETLDSEKKKRIEEVESIKYEILNIESEKGKVSAGNDKIREEYAKISLEEEKIKAGAGLVNEKIKQAHSAIDEYTNTCKRLNDRIGEIENRIENDKNGIESIKTKKAELEGKSGEIEAEYARMEEKFSGVKEKIDAAKSELRELNESLNFLKLKKDHTNLFLDNAVREKTRHDEKLKKMQSQLDESGESLSGWEKKLEEIESGKKDAGSRSKSAESEFKELNDEHGDLLKRTSQLKDEIREARSEISVLIREEENFRGFSSAFQALMKERENLPNVTPVHTVIRVAPEYETAIDVVLGAHFQSLITENKKDADTCIEFLKRERAGRLTFFPMDLERKADSNYTMPRGHSGIIGWAKDLISTEPEYRDIIDMICGKTLVVKDLPSAYKIYEVQKKNRDFLPRLVTLEGDVIEFTGAVTGGKYRTDRSALLSRTRRREELEKSLSEKLAWFEKAEKRAGEIKVKLDEADKNYRDAADKLSRLEKEEHEISAQLAVLKNMRSQAGDDMKDLGESGDEIDKRIKDEEASLKQIEAELEKAAAKIAESEKAAKAVEEENSAFIIEMDEVRKSRDSVKREIEEADKNAGQIESRLESDARYIEENKRDIIRIEESKKEKEAQIEELKAELLKIEEKSGAFKEDAEKFRSKIEESKRALEEVERNLDEKRRSLVEAENSRSALDEKINLRRFEKIELESKKTYLEERLKEFKDETIEAAKTGILPRAELVNDVEKTRKTLNSFEGINFSAEEEYAAHRQRFDFLKTQIDDLQDAAKSLRNIIKEMDHASLRALEDTIGVLDERFGSLFAKVFGGGKARVFFTDPENKLESGVEIEVQPPGKRTTNLGLMSSGEKSLTAVTFLFALLSIKPGPFVLLDELDAPLDETNVEKIAALVREFSAKSQFILVTHNRKTMEYGDTLIGITMESPGVSKVVSVKFEDVEKFTQEKVFAK